jgi:hypothetical protein
MATFQMIFEAKALRTDSVQGLGGQQIYGIHGPRHRGLMEARGHHGVRAHRPHRLHRPHGLTAS